VVKLSAWDKLKLMGSAHYKTGKVEPIDLYRAARPHHVYNAFDVKALTDIIKYAFRLLTRGYLQADVDKIRHYLALFEADMQDVKEEPNTKDTVLIGG